MHGVGKMAHSDWVESNSVKSAPRWAREGGGGGGGDICFQFEDCSGLLVSRVSSTLTPVRVSCKLKSRLCFRNAFSVVYTDQGTLAVSVNI